MTEARICPGPCNDNWQRVRAAHQQAMDTYQDTLAGWQAVAADRRGPPPEPPQPLTVEATPGEPVWCTRCVASVRAALAELDDLAALLASHADGYRQHPPGDPVTGTGELASPSPVADTLDELYRELAGLEDLWRSHRGYPARPARGHGAHARTLTLAWLAGQLEDILTDEGMAAFGRGVLTWRARLRAMAHAQPEQRRRPGICPRCDTRALRRRDDGITCCENCGRRMDEDEYQHLITGQDTAAAAAEGSGS